LLRRRLKEFMAILKVIEARIRLATEVKPLLWAV
jgi:hypothetical protein